MVEKLYLDGCSLTYGHGLSREQNLGALLSKNYTVTDQSRNGKSNIMIAMDAYANHATHDVFMLGFTYSARFGIRYQNFNLDFFPGYHGQGLGLPSVPNSYEVDTAFSQVYKYFFSVYGPPYCDDLSDMLIDGVISFLKSQGKKVVAWTWETRKTSVDLFAPYIAPKMRLEDGHLNEQGTEYLYQLVTNLANGQ